MTTTPRPAIPTTAIYRVVLCCVVCCRYCSVSMLALLPPCAYISGQDSDIRARGVLRTFHGLSRALTLGYTSGFWFSGSRGAYVVTVFTLTFVWVKIG
ncbi:hypothetical protein C8Q80DRAFT_1156735 [Daedaleopsis nitida]|nr:hypothetical protein C8Q80DRAFT_1156735 [Daedaleopsis nitida]